MKTWSVVWVHRNGKPVLFHVDIPSGGFVIVCIYKNIISSENVLLNITSWTVNEAVETWKSHHFQLIQDVRP